MFITSPSRMFASALFCAAIGFGVPANAITYDIQVLDTDGSTSVGQVYCESFCEGFTLGGSTSFPTGPGTLSTTEAAYYGLGGSSPANETLALNTLIGAVTFNPDGSDATKSVESPDPNFFTSAEYFSFKLGAGTYFFHLFGTGNVNIIYEEIGGSGSGLSHYTEWGMSEVPLPAALPMFLLALGGLGFVGRRRRQAAA
jgi:hypothetical protein